MRQLWMTATGSINAIAAVDRGVAGRVFGSIDAIALGGWPGATHGRAWASYETFAQDVRSHAIPDGVTLVMYDPEAWDKTPLDERLDPVRYIEEVCAKNADVYETQAQRLQNEPDVYRAFVLETALLARSVNANVRVLSGLSTHPGYPAIAEMLEAAWSSVRDVVDGHYLSLAKRRLVDVAASFLSRMVMTRELERLDATASG